MILRFYHYLVRRFWCRFFGHVWTDWNEHRHANAAMHTRSCLRCAYGEIKEGMAGLVRYTMTEPDRLKKIREAMFANNALVEALQRNRVAKTLDGGATIEKATK